MISPSRSTMSRVVSETPISMLCVASTNRHARLLLRDVVGEYLPGSCVKARLRLVQQQQRRMMDQRPHQGHALCHAA